MRIFITGATGFIGSAVVQELIQAGHQVTGLARSESGAKSLATAGADVHRGDLQDLESLRSGAAASDGVIHTAFIHNFSKFKENCEIDRRAVETLGKTLADSDRPLIVTSGTALLAPGRLVTEADMPVSGVNPRIASENAAASAAAHGARVTIVRLPPSVHGQGDHGFVPILIRIAREKGVSAYVGDGLNRWPAVHRFDAAHLYRLAIERASAGTVYHGVAEEGVAFRDIAEVIGRRLDVPAVSKSAQQAAEHFGWFAHFAAVNNPTSSTLTRQTLGWIPKQTGLLEDMNQSDYFS